jgi:GTPase
VHVVDASDESRDDHIATTEALLAELGLDEIPRVLVFNKTDLLAPIERALLGRREPDAVVVSAMDRATTRPLVDRIANELAERWDESAKVPAPPLEEDVAEAEAAPDEREPPVDASTLDELLRAAGRRPRPPKAKPKPRVVAGAARPR